MSVTIASSKRDGRLCTVTVNITSATSGTTSFDVVGNIVQCSVNRTRGTDAFSLSLTDTSSNTTFFSKTNLQDTDINPSQINSGAGGYCRGPMQVSAVSTNDSYWTVVVYYIKM